MSEDYTPSMDDIAEYYTACRMRGYDEVQGGEPYAIVRARYKEGFNHVIAAHDAELREQVAQEILSRLPKLLADDSENEDGWLSDWDGQVWPAADDTRVDLTGDGSIDLDHIASHAVSIAQGKE